MRSVRMLLDCILVIYENNFLNKKSSNKKKCVSIESYVIKFVNCN